MSDTNNMELSEEIKEEVTEEFAEDEAKESGPKANWYVVHTYSGYENKVKANIEKTIENRHLEDEILEVRVPMQDVTEVKNGVRKTSAKKMFPGYVLINMVITMLHGMLSEIQEVLPDS